MKFRFLPLLMAMAFFAMSAGASAASFSPETGQGRISIGVASQHNYNWIAPEEQAIDEQTNCPSDQVPGPGARSGEPCSGFESGPSILTWDFPPDGLWNAHASFISGWDNPPTADDQFVVLVGGTNWLENQWGVTPPNVGSGKLGDWGCCVSTGGGNQVPYAIVDTDLNDPYWNSAFLPAEQAATFDAYVMDLLVNPYKAVKVNGAILNIAGPPMTFAYNNICGSELCSGGGGVYDALDLALSSYYASFTFPYHTSYTVTCPGFSALPGTNDCPLADWTTYDYWWNQNPEERSVNYPDVGPRFDRLGILTDPGGYSCAADPNCFGGPPPKRG